MCKGLMLGIKTAVKVSCDSKTPIKIQMKQDFMEGTTVCDIK